MSFGLHLSLIEAIPKQATDIYGKIPKLVGGEGWGLERITSRIDEPYESYATGLPDSSHRWSRSASAVAGTDKTDEVSFQLDFGGFGGKGLGLFLNMALAFTRRAAL